ncbi:hypothetical protein MBLNU230_g6676t1 [Neophaeotheca triangularis]
MGSREYEEEDADLEAANTFISARPPLEESQRLYEPHNTRRETEASPPSSSFDIEDEPTTSPRWQRAATKLGLPHSAKVVWESVKTWVQGPSPPRIYKIAPIFPKLQRAPLKLLDNYASETRQRFWLLVAVYALWFAHCGIILRSSVKAASTSDEYGQRVNLECTTRLWESAQSCAIGGELCRPFADSDMAFRCPADCQDEFLLSPYTVGDRQVAYEPLVIGGPASEHDGPDSVANATYRGDSFICASAIHADLFRASTGGCGVLSLLGEQFAFHSSTRNGLRSTGFDSYFPQSFAFLSGSNLHDVCEDPRWSLLTVSVFYTTMLSLFTTNSAVFFWSIFIMLFFHVSFASDPPSPMNYYDILSISLGNFLPATFCAWVTYSYTVKRSLENLTAQFEKTILWLGPAWIGALNNITFDRLPLQRLTPTDIKSQPGAIPTLVTIVLIIFLIALSQAWSFRIEGRMPRYLLLYALLVLSILTLIALPGESLRLHHYILALLLLPGTSFQNRSSLVYQGLLVGLFINGTARWGFASILETPAALLQGAPSGSLLPAVSVAAIGVGNITFDLGMLPVREETGIVYEGVSVLVNDVERSREWRDGVDVVDGRVSWTWTRHVAEDASSEEKEITLGEGEEKKRELAEYFRFGYVSRSASGDYTKAGVWRGDGEWVKPAKGPS